MAVLDIQREVKELYSPYRHQMKLHISKARFKFDMMPVRCGKSIWLVTENVLDMLAKKEMWTQRPDTMKPKWNVWFCADTTELLKQLWWDTLEYTPNELFDGMPVETLTKSNTSMKIKGGGLFTFKSTKKGVAGSQLVAQGVDRVNITEAGQMTRNAWDRLQARLASPDRVEFSSAAAEGTPRGQVDPDDPTLEQWFWEEIQRGRRPGVDKSLYDSMYWYEDRHLPELGGGRLDHPILSYTEIGRAEMKRQKDNPNLSELKYLEDWMGKCMPTVEGKPIIKGFMPAIHVNDKAIYSPRFELYRFWDFSYNYPAVIFFQIYSDGTIGVIDEYVPYDLGLIDEELADKVIEWTFTNHLDVDEERIIDWGDFEGNQQTDQRKDNTVQILRKKGINLQTNPTVGGDEQLAQDILNARMKLRDDGQPYLIIHPRCVLSIKAFGGMWFHKTIKINGIESYRPFVEESHPWIDIFDCFKMFIVNVVKRRGQADVSQGRRVRAIMDSDGTIIGTETY